MVTIQYNQNINLSAFQLRQFKKIHRLLRTHEVASFLHQRYRVTRAELDKTETGLPSNIPLQPIIVNNNRYYLADDVFKLALKGITK